MINERQRDRGHAMLAEAIEQGARVVEGGTYDGLFYRPTVVVDVPRRSRLWAEEIFAPIAPVVAGRKRGGGARAGQRHASTAWSTPS